MTSTAFGHDYIHIYNSLLAGTQLENEINFIKPYLNTKTILLDLCCGHGRHISKLSKYVSKAVGIDLNTEAISTALSESGSSRNVSFWEADALEVDLDPGSFDVVLMMCNSFGLFTLQEELLLQKIFDALSSEGIFIFDITNRDTQLRHKNCDFWTENEHGIILQKRIFNMQTSELTLKETRIPKYSDESHYDITIRLYALHEVLNMVNKIGFSDVKCYDGFSQNEYNGNSEHFVFVCRK